MTTDTALLVSNEILEGRSDFSSLKFVEDPSIPIDSSVVRFLDEALPLKQIGSLPSDKVVRDPGHDLAGELANLRVIREELVK